MSASRIDKPLENDQSHSGLGSPYWRLWISTVSSNLGDGIGFIAYPWLASAATREPLLIALVGVMGGLPWLLFSLPSGAIIDRVDRKKLVVGMDFARGVITALAAVFLLFFGKALPTPAQLEGGLDVQTNWPVYLMFLVTSLLMGTAQVFRDNAATSLMPAIVRKDQLEKANGRMWSAEMIAGNLAGPPLGSLLIGISILLPIIADSATFFFAAGLIFTIPGMFRPVRDGQTDRRDTGQPSWVTDVKEGVRWLRNHTLLWPMAIILALINVFGNLATGTMILFLQEVIRTDPFEFALTMTGGALGGAIGGLVASKVSSRWGAGTAVQMLLWLMPLANLVIGFSSHWTLVWMAFGFSMLIAIVWNTITVSLRQSIIPDHLMGRVNAAYRFLVIGTAPIGTAIGGAMVSITDGWNREWALRSPWIASAVLGWLLAWGGYRYLTNDKVNAAKREAGIPV